MDKQRAAPLYGFLVAIIWGLSFLSIKVSVAVLPPMTLASARFALAVAVLPLLAWAAKEKLGIAWRDVPILAAGGLVGVTIYFLCENNGVARLSASESSLVIGTIPVCTLLAERAFIGTKMSGRTWVGTALSVAGVTLIVLRSGVGGESPSDPVGYLFMAGAALSWVAYAFLTKPVAARYGKINVTFWQSLFGLVGCLPFAFAERGSGAPISLKVALNVAYLGLLCSAAGYWLYMSAMDVLGAGKTSVFINLVPVVSVVAAYFILGERLGAGQLAGGAVAVAGVYLATIPPRSRGTASRRRS
jgi:drug/metabolite transporter (DMT)-like permease